VEIMSLLSFSTMAFDFITSTASLLYKLDLLKDSKKITREEKYCKFLMKLDIENLNSQELIFCILEQQLKPIL
jgi:hypothetical protein